MSLPVITKIENRKHFAELLKENPGVFIIKFGATWCGPCKQVEPLINSYFNNIPENIQCAHIDVDESMDVYGFLKTKKMVHGIPAILAYYKGNENYIPDDMVAGADENKIRKFFKTCYEQSKLL
jgi:thioredoxin 1